MATQLTRNGLKGLMANRTATVIIPVRVLTAVCVFAVAATMVSLVVGIHNAQRDEAAARRNYADSQALLALPPLSTDSLKEDLTVAKASLATVQAGVAPSNISAASDDTTSLLVKRSQAGGLAVRGITRVIAAQAKLGDNTYDVQAVHVTVDGKPGQIVALLTDLGSTNPSLIPSLTSLTVNEAGLGHADISFSTYTKVVPPTPVPIATPKKAKR